MFGRSEQGPKLQGKVVLMRKAALDIGNVWDNILELANSGVTCQLVSSTVLDATSKRGVVGREERLENWGGNLPGLTTGDSTFALTFHWDVAKLGVPGALIVKNRHATEFFLKTVTIDGVHHGRPLVFVANSWVYSASKYRNYPRVFFTNQSSLPNTMPPALLPYREDELRHLRGDDDHALGHGPYQVHDRVYRYDVYNDLGKPDQNNPRPVLGGSDQYPYPRRARTGRKPTRTDPKSESRDVIPLIDDFYVPRDERFGHIKLDDFRSYALKAVSTAVLPLLRERLDSASPQEFDDFDDILKLYEGGIKLPTVPALEDFRKNFPIQLVKNLLPAGGEFIFKLPVPQIIKENKLAWRTDEEFAREMLAGVNPNCIRRLRVFPPTSTLDPAVYGDQTSTITEEHIKHNISGGLSVQQGVDAGRIFILDHHDNFMPFLLDVNNLKPNFIYATRTLLFLQDDGTLKPLAIELSLPRLSANGATITGADSKVYTPPPPSSECGVEAGIWQLAKAYAAVNDSAWHQLVSHWLNTHAVMEPFIIAINRQLSKAHPIHKLLHPHCRDTLDINAKARQILISAGGIFELTVFPGKYALGISSQVYRSWNFTEEALPEELIKRGVAERGPDGELKLLIEDYPYAVDGLAIWRAIETWVDEYCSIYYPNDGVVQGDVELQAWWKEVREVGHGDLKDRPWWPKMKTVKELVRSCATIIWIASALHAAVNFGQYPYAGYLPNRPTVSRRPMPEPGTKEYEELKRDPDAAFIHTITAQFQSIIGVSLIETLSVHSSDEVYLGQRDTPEWTADGKAKAAFDRFSRRLIDVEERIVRRNGDPKLKNRKGPANFPYMLLYPNTSDADGETATGITAMGIPNSISI